MQKILVVNAPSNSLDAVVGQQVSALAAADIKVRVRASTRVSGGVTVRVSDSDYRDAADVLNGRGLLDS